MPNWEQMEAKPLQPMCPAAAVGLRAQAGKANRLVAGHVA